MASSRRLVKLQGHLHAQPVAKKEKRTKLTEEDDKNALLIPKRRNNMPNKAVGIGVDRTEWMNR